MPGTTPCNIGSYNVTLDECRLNLFLNNFVSKCLKWDSITSYIEPSMHGNVKSNKHVISKHGFSVQFAFVFYIKLKVIVSWSLSCVWLICLCSSSEVTGAGVKGDLKKKNCLSLISQPAQRNPFIGASSFLLLGSIAKCPENKGLHMPLLNSFVLLRKGTNGLLWISHSSVHEHRHVQGMDMLQPPFW